MARSEDAAAGAFLSIAGLAFLVCLAALVLAGWLLIRAAHLTANAFAVNPRSRLLWWLIVATGCTIAFYFITKFIVFAILALLLAAVFLVACKAIVLAATPVLLREMTPRDRLHSVLSEWWPETDSDNREMEALAA